ncbi:MAG TPA: hypothetical protein VNF99_03240 [Stellaceae bacterium]|nr:hypothetical protein [Stellaceae bacterium]
MRAAVFLAALALASIATAARASEKVEVRAGEHAGYGRIAIQWPKPVAYEAKVAGEVLTIHFARPFTGPLSIIDRKLDRDVASVAQSADGMTVTAQLVRPMAIKTSVVNRATVVIDLVAPAARPVQKPAAKAKTAKPEARKTAELQAPAQAAPLAIVPPAGVPETAAAPPPAATGPASGLPAPPPAADQAASNAGPVAFAPLFVSESGHASLRFDWPGPTAAAVYRRDGALWIVFAAPAKLDLDGLRAQSQGVLSAIDAVPADGGTALRLVAADGLNPSVRRAGNSWIIDLKNGAAAPDAPIIVDPRPGASLPSVELHVHEASAPLRIKDPVLGDTLIVVPVSELGRGIDATRSFVDFRLLTSVQGIVIRPNTDDLSVHPDVDTVEITRPNGLVLSDERDRLLGGAPTDLHRLFDFAAWRGPDTETFIERRSQLDNAVAAVAPAARTPPRLDLARFYFAHLFGAETLGVLDQIERDDPQAAADRSVHALKGAACFLADDTACAQHELGVAALDNEPEAALWRGALAARGGDWNTASREFIDGISLLPSYPKALRNRFALAAAEALIETDRGSAAGPLIDIVLKDSPNAGDHAMAEYLTGRREQQLGQLEPALEKWVKVAASGDRKARARALYARAMALYDTKQASRIETINALDALRFSWRGDIFEFTLLRKLGELQLAEGNVDDGIEALHEAAVYFRNYPASKEVAKEAADSFADLFLGKSADDVPPVKALALYTEFHDLEPAGARHDAIVKKLIDRLVAVDLLDQATALLDDQVKNHLTGRDKARGATQLALLRLMNRQPDAAVSALDIDVGSDLPTDLVRQRLELRARALTDLNKAPAALALLANDNSVDAARLRADIYWHQQDWKDAAKVFAALAGAPPAQGPLGVDLSRVMLAWAAALTLDGDQQGVDKLRKDWGPAIAGTQTAQAFDLITEDPTTGLAGGGSAADVAARIAEIGTLQSFMSAYRQRLASGGLSAIN